MKEPTLKEIDDIRKKQLRPQIVACILHQRKLLFVYQPKFQLWQLPQGGIDNQENIRQTVRREMTEELGKDFAKNLQIDRMKIIGADKIIFPQQTQGTRPLQTDSGRKIFMLGKKYFFIVIPSATGHLPQPREFAGYHWADYRQALKIANSTKQKGKQRLLKQIIKKLKDNNLLD